MVKMREQHFEAEGSCENVIIRKVFCFSSQRIYSPVLTLPLLTVSLFRRPDGAPAFHLGILH